MQQVVQTRPRIGAFIRLLRQRRGLSGRALGPRAGLSTGYVSKVEAGDIEPSLACFARLAVALNMSPLEVWVIIRIEAAATADDITVTASTYSDHIQSDEDVA